MRIPLSGLRASHLLPALLLLLAAAAWLASVEEEAGQPAPQAVEQLRSGAAASMDSPVFDFPPGWQVSAAGADSSEPERPWEEPSGRLRFVYRGSELALKLALGDYWGYVFVSVDGRPANRLAVLPGNRDSAGRTGGYKPLLAPEKQLSSGPAAEWVVVHRAAVSGPHEVEVEVWRGWGQTVLRGVAVDGLPPSPRPVWPGVLLAIAGIWLAARAAGPPLMARAGGVTAAAARFRSASATLGPLRSAPWQVAALLAALSLLGVGSGVLTQNWLLASGGLALLGIAGLLRPVAWCGALLFALPLYLQPLPILPGRALNLVEIGVYGGLALHGLRYLLFHCPLRADRNGAGGGRMRLLYLVAAAALVASFAAEQRGVALREWRTVFLVAPLFGMLLHFSIRSEREPAGARYALALAWLAGGAFISLAGLWQYAWEQNVIQAEGVNRVRAFYGSPNNLALYLERTVAVALALAIFGGGSRREGRPPGPASVLSWPQSGAFRLGALLLVLPQLAALLLTFSKGALLLGVPAMLLGLAVAGRRLANRRMKDLPAWWGWGLAAVAAAMGLALVPFLGTERFRSLLDFSPEGTGGIRLNLWRSSLQMALDHPWLGVGPDNFLYKYRSGYILPDAWRDPSLNHPHNLALDWWTRVGLPGLAAAAAWLALGVRALWRAAGSDALAVGCLGAIAAAAGHGLIDASYALPDLMLVWVFLLHLFTLPAKGRPAGGG